MFVYKYLFVKAVTISIFRVEFKRIMMNASYSNLNENLCLEYYYIAFPKNLCLDRCLSIIYNAIIVYLIHG